MRKLLLGIFILLTSQGVIGQGRLGIKAGANYFTLHSGNTKTSDYSNGRAGFIIGFSYELAINPRFSVQPELNYSYQTAKEDYRGTQLQLGYVQLPILFKFNIPLSRTSIYTGPQLGFLASGRYKTGNGSSDASNDLVQTDFGITLGAGYVPSHASISFDVRLYKGFMNVIKSEYDGGTKTRTFLIMATVGFLFGEKK